MRYFLIITLLTSTIFASNTTTQDSQATEKTKEDFSFEAKLTERKKYEDLIRAHREYLRSMPESTKTEISDFRKKIDNLNQQKTEEYKKLSSAARDFFTKERDLKSKIPTDFLKAKKKEYTKGTNKK
jgi:hypothetical protein